MAYRTSLVFVTLFCVVYVSVAQTTNSSQQSGVTSDGSIGQKTALEKGAGSLFDLTHNFLNTVQKQNFIEDNGGAISYTELETIFRNGTYSELQTRWRDLFAVFGGYAACFIVGLLFIIVMPIVGMFFCCCYCCCKCCGKAKSKEDPPNAKCKRTTYCLLLAVMATMMLAGAIVAIISNELMHTKLKNDDNRGPYQYVKSGITDLIQFADITTDDLITTTKNTVDTTVANIISSVNDSAATTVKEVIKLINAEQLLKQTEDLGKHVNDSLKSLENVKSSLITLRETTANITTSITTIQANILQQECANKSLSVCPTVSLSVGPDFSGLSTLDDVANAVGSSTDISGLVTVARAEFDKATDKVYDSVNSTIKDAESKTQDIKNNINSQIGSINETINPFVRQLKDLRDDVKSENDKLVNDKYFDYEWYGGIGVSCLLALIVIFYYMGILFGICGERPGRGAPCCNRGAGSNFLVAGVVFTFFFSWILMLACTLLFLPGGLLYTNVCRYLNDGVENLGKFEGILESNKIDIKHLLYGDNASTSSFTLGGALSDCKNNSGLYSAIQLDNRFNLDSQLNASQLLNEVDKLVSGATFSLPTVSIIPDNLNKSLNDFAKSGIMTINFTSFDEQLNADLIDNLTSTIDVLTFAGLTETASALRSLEDNQLTALRTQMNQLKSDLDHLKNNSDLQNEVNNLTAGLNAAQTDFNANGDQLVKDQLNITAQGIKRDVTKALNDVKYKVRHDIGRCQPIYTATQKLSDAFCVVFLDPFNTFWFGIGWSLFFSIFSIVFALLLANMYQREEPIDPDTRRAMKRSKQDQRTQDFENPEIDHYQGYGRSEDHIPLTSVDRNGYYGNSGIHNSGYKDQGYQGDHYSRRPERPPSYHDSRHYPPAPQYHHSQGGYPYNAGYSIAPQAAPRDRSHRY